MIPHAPPACLKPALVAPPWTRRYALDVNISSLDVLNHKRLLDSARADPSAVSFQLRPVDVVSGSDLAKRPSFGSLDTLQYQHEVGQGEAWSVGGKRAAGATSYLYWLAVTRNAQCFAHAAAAGSF